MQKNKRYIRLSMVFFISFSYFIENANALLSIGKKRIFGFTTILLTSLFVYAGSASAAEVETHHPRLFLNGSTQAEGEADLQRIITQLKTGGMYHHAFTQADELNAQGNAGRYGGDDMLKMFRAIEDDGTEPANTYREDYIAEAKAVTNSGDYYNGHYEILFTLAMFDWFRSQWNETETEQLIAYLKERIRRDEWTDKTVLGNHFHEDHSIIRIVPGLVLYGETAGSENGNDLWTGYGSGSLGIQGAEYWIEQELKPTFQDIFGSYGMSPEGNSYWRRGHPHLMPLAMAWTSCTDEDLFQTWTITNFTKSLLYNWRPSDGKLIPWSDGVTGLGVINESDRFMRYGGGYKNTFTIFLPLMRWANSSEASYIYNTMYNIPDNLEGIYAADTGTTYGDIFIKFLLGDAFGPRNSTDEPLYDPAPVDLNTLPKSVYYDGYEGVIIRSGWDPGDVLFGYKQNAYVGGHDNADAGSFVITKSDYLAMDSGHYSSNGDVLDEHTHYYSPRTIAHNTITVYKPGQYINVQYWPGARNDSNDDGGQRGFGRESGDGTVSGTYDPPFDYAGFGENKHHRGSVNRFEYSETEGYTYFTSDVTPAYFSDSVANYTRTVLSPDAEHFIMLDRVSSTDASYPKRWLLHTENEPQAVDGTKGSQNASDGSVVYSNGNEFYAQNGSDRLFVKMLAPNNNNADTVLFRGGSGYEYWYGYDSSGFNAIQQHEGPESLDEPGNWRIEEKIVGETDSIFLNVLYATDNTTQNIGNVEQLQNTSANAIGVQLENYVAIFSKAETKDGSHYLENISYIIPDNGITDHIITDLQANMVYEVIINSSVVDTLNSSSQGIISFNRSASSGDVYQVVLNGDLQPTYTLTVNVPSGGGIVSPDTGSYSFGTNVILTATPENGYQIRSWQGTDNDSSTANTNSLTIIDDTTVTVQFEQTDTNGNDGGNNGNSSAGDNNTNTDGNSSSSCFIGSIFQ